jgi:peptide deformylase
MRKLLDPFDTKLNMFSREVSKSEISAELVKSVVEDMQRTALGDRDVNHPDLPSLVGLAAPQIGELIRIILIDINADPGKTNMTPMFKIFINPRIIKSSNTDILSREGCRSTGNICGAVYRAKSVTVTALNESGKEFEYESANDFLSCILQHEIDHLNGIRFPSRVRNESQLHLVKRADFQKYRENWRTWSKLYPYTDWLKMFNGEKPNANV